MINIIIINNDSLLEHKTKDLNVDNIYKKCNYKSNKDFINIYKNKYESNILELWGKNKGNNKSINNNEILKLFNVQVYGKCILLLKDNNNDFQSLNINDLNNYLINKHNFDYLEKNNKNLNNKNLNNKNDDLNNNSCIINESLNDLNLNNTNTNNDDNESIYSESLNSELSYELYDYSSDN